MGVIIDTSVWVNVKRGGSLPPMSLPLPVRNPFTLPLP